MAAAPKAQELNTWDLKSLYFVEDLTGNPQHQECKEFDPGQRPIGRKIQVIFKDGETMVGPPKATSAVAQDSFLCLPIPHRISTAATVVTSAIRNIAFI